MAETIKVKGKNRIKKLEKIAETRMAVYIYIYIYIVYCHLENKKANLEVAGHKFEYNFVKFNNRIRDRTILKLGIRLFKRNYYNLNLVVISIDLSLFGYT